MESDSVSHLIKNVAGNHRRVGGMDSGKAEPQKTLWRTASYSVGNGACIEVSSVNGNVLVRDSKIQDSPIIGYPAETWRSFLIGIKAK
jgi:Domain of unknown function (DUF397)